MTKKPHEAAETLKEAAKLNLQKRH